MADTHDPVEEFVERIIADAGDRHAIARTLAALVLRELDSAESDTHRDQRIRYWENILEQRA